MNLIEEFRKNILQFNMINRGDRVIAGVSGGRDSMAMLHLLLSYKNQCDIELIVAHINHGVRGEEADKDEELVRTYCSDKSLEFRSLTADMNAFASENRLSKEEAGRKLRNDFFDSLSPTKICLAHNLDDQVETVLMRILRGTGISGLKGIDFVNGRKIRPLLSISREDITTFVKTECIPYRDDKTNDESVYMRNKIRNELIPLLKSEYNPNITKALLGVSIQAKEYDDYIDIKSLENLRKIGFDGKSLKIEEFKELSILEQKEVLRKAIHIIKGDLDGVSRENIDDAIKLIYSQSGKKLSFCGMIFNISFNLLRMGLIKNPDVDLNENQENNFHENKVYFSINDEVVEFLNGEILIAESLDFDVNKRSDFSQFFDADRLSSNLLVRTRFSGDKIAPIGFNGTKKLKKRFIEKKIPEDMRMKIPIIVSDDEIVWAIGVDVSREFVADENTKKIIKMTWRS